jgi:betaine-aldehyde dehydrogenase
VSDTIGLERTHVEQASSRLAMNWVNGAWVDAAKRSDSYDPATGERIGTYAHAVRADAEVAVQAAVRAFKSTDWKDNRRLRAKVLNQLAGRFEARREDLIDILSLENGKVRIEAAFEVDMIPSKFRYWAAVVLTDYGRAMEVLPGHLSVVARSAIGVAGIIAPFNSPLVLTVRSLAPALAAGVTTLIKLPGNTAQTNFLFSKVLAEAVDLPKGVINVISGSGGGGAEFSWIPRMSGSSVLPEVRKRERRSLRRVHRHSSYFRPNWAERPQ